MISALAFLQYHSTKNRLLLRFKRLKQPKYLIGAVVGGLYFYWYFSRFLFAPRGRLERAGATAGLPVDPLLYESIGALVLLVLVLLAWLIPHKRAALAFTEAEVAFLFPAPVSRRMLMHFKLLRSQLAILFTVLLFTYLSTRLSTGNGLIRAAGWWVMLSTLNLHFLGSSFARTLMLDRGISNWKRRGLVLAMLLAGLGIVGVWAVRGIPELRFADLADFESLKQYGEQVLVSGPLPYLLSPFRLVVRPYLATDWLALLSALWPAALLLALHYWWIIRADVAFEEASVEASQKIAERIAAARAGNWQAANRKLRAKHAPFPLRPHGPAAVALLWKNLIGAGNAFTLRTWIILAAVVFGVSMGMRGASSASNWLAVLAGFAVALGFMAVLLGPQLVRQDFRQDLQHADMLKLLPMRGWQIALGEILAPAVILTAVHWLLIIVAVALLPRMAEGNISGSLVLALGAGAAVVLPMLNMISLLIPNAAVLLFPGWFQPGKDAPHGIEATGQRLVFALGQFLAFIVALLPAAAVFTGFFFLVKLIAGSLLAVPVAALAAAAVLGLEAGLGVMLLGWLFERLDLSAEPT